MTAAAADMLRLQHLNTSTIATATTTAILAGIGGYLLGQARRSFVSSDRLLGRGRRAARSRGGGSSSSDEEDSDVSTGGGRGGGLSDFKGSPGNEEYKLVLVVRTDLGMTKGKIAAQCSHATLACYKTLLRSPNRSVLDRWERQAQSKVAVQAKSEDELMTLQAQAISLGLCARVIRDAGRTQIASGSATVLGVGPGPKSLVDQVTGRLKLL
ncbi:MAG: hypothetical protein M1816_006205 [Peltula sp. TS41687]|nr:MAG: hypothetical protein M1816_006205 [Peltula sp. TS41687]